MGTLYKVTLYLETDNYEDSGIEGEKVWRQLHWTRARQWEDAMDTFSERLTRDWGLPFSEDNSSRYLIEMSAYDRTYPALDMTRAIKKRLRELAKKRTKRSKKWHKKLEEKKNDNRIL
jgi:hypothetical protein